MVLNKLKLLVQDLFYPSLRTKKIQGLSDVFEMSVNMDIRILWKYENGVIILLIDVGHHKDILGIWRMRAMLSFLFVEFCGRFFKKFE